MKAGSFFYCYCNYQRPCTRVNNKSVINIYFVFLNQEENLLQDEYVPFPRISHVRQQNNSDFWSLETVKLNLRNEETLLPELKNGAKNNFGLNLDFSAQNVFDENALPKIERLSVEQVHKNIITIRNWRRLKLKGQCGFASTEQC